jgi:hypothetical protein
MTRKVVAKLKRRVKGHSGTGRANLSLESLVLELFGVVRRALTTYGVTPAQQKRLFGQSQRATLKRVSSSMLEQFRGVGDLVSTWRQELPYVDEAGQPRVLDITGRGATFQTLARRYLPTLPLAEGVTLACRTASVGVLAGGRIALYGDTMVNLSTDTVGALAQNISHIRQIFDTCLYNLRTPRDHPGLGRIERVVGHQISACEFVKFQRSIRPQIHDLCERVDRVLKSHTRRSPRGKGSVGNAGMGIYVYYDGEMKHVKKGRRGTKG